MSVCDPGHDLHRVYHAPELIQSFLTCPLLVSVDGDMETG